MSAPDTFVPVAVVGGGPAGMALALALAQRGIESQIFESRSRQAVQEDARVLALSHGSRQVLERLGAWPTSATPITSVHVSHRRGLGRTKIRASDLDVEALGYVVAARTLINVLDKAVRAAHIAYHEGHSIDVSAVKSEGDSISVIVGGSAVQAPHRINAQLVAWAEGAVDPASAVRRDYNQHAVVCTVAVMPGHGNVAWERFTDDGPLALLPLGDAYAVVLTCDSNRLQDVLALDDEGFCLLLSQRIGTRHEFRAVSPRVAYPLGLRWRTEVTGARQVWLGNAAQTLHPVAGQGFNLALRDIWELAQCLSPAADAGSENVLQTYARQRSLDRRGTIGFTDVLIEVFSSDFGPLRHGRGAGLMALDMLPPLRNFVARRLMFGAKGGL